VRAQAPLLGAGWARGLGSTGVRALLIVVLVMGGMGLQRLKGVAGIVTQSQRECMIEMAVWVRSVVPRDGLVAIGDIGAFSYFTKLPIFDIHPKSLTDGKIAREGFSNEYFFSRDPRLVALNVRGMHVPKMAPEHYVLYRSDEFNQRYRFVGTIRHRYYLDRSYWIYVRKDMALTGEALARFPVGVGHERRLGFSLSRAGSSR
jgi:hypothetical protein